MAFRYINKFYFSHYLNANGTFILVPCFRSTEVFLTIVLNFLTSSNVQLLD